MVSKSKPYSWDEIKEVLTKELKKTKHIMSFGTIGSCNVEHDIDIIVTKKPSAKSSDFYKEFHAIFDVLEKYLVKNYGAKAIRLQGGRSAELTHLSKATSIDLVFDSMVYTSYSQIKRDWEWAMFKDARLDDLLKGQKFLLGNFSDIISDNFKREQYYDPVFIYIYHYDRLQSHYLPKVFLEITNKSLDYLYRKRLGLKSPVVKSNAQAREAFYKLCDILDKLEMEKRG